MFVFHVLDCCALDYFVIKNYFLYNEVVQCLRNQELFKNYFLYNEVVQLMILRTVSHVGRNDISRLSMPMLYMP